MSCDLKLSDLLELSKVYAPEYNMPELHDRVLVFDVMKDGWETDGILKLSSNDGDSENVASSESIATHSNETVQENAKSEDQSNSEPNKSVHETGSTSGTDSGSALSHDEGTSTPSEETESFSSAEKPGHSDILRQHRIFVHSTWLAVQSKYFRSLFYSGLKESNSDEVHVKVSESEEASHLMLLEAVYKADILNDGTVDELLEVMELADKYDVKFVFKKCKYVLQTRVDTVDICKQVMHVIKEKHSFDDVEDLAASMQVTMGSNFSPLEKHWQTEDFTSQSQPFVQYLLSSTSLLVRCENTVFQALMNWMETNKVDPASLPQESDLLKSVIFEKMTIDYLYNVVRAHPIANKMPGFQELLLKGMTYHALTPNLKQRLGEVTPRHRQGLSTGVPQFIWNISKAQLETQNSTTPIESETFWLCGYKAKMYKLYYSSDRTNCTVRMQLCILDLTTKNFVPLSWSITAPGTSATTTFNFRSGGGNGDMNLTIPRSHIVGNNSIQLMVTNF